MAFEINVLIPIFPGVDLLDLSGPMEVLRRGSRRLTFNFTIVSYTEDTKTAQGITIKRKKSFAQAMHCIGDFHILIQPGGPLGKINAYRRDPPAFDLHLGIIDHFTTLCPIHGEPYVLLSIGSGALLISPTGAFAGLRATTCIEALETLHHDCEEYRMHGGKPATILPELESECKLVGVENGKKAIFGATPTKRNIFQSPRRLSQRNSTPVRWVDAGYNQYQIRVITSAGGNCALDASLFLLSELEGVGRAAAVARSMDYAWRWG